jgi:hypothetical protein
MSKADRIARLSERLAQSKHRDDAEHILNVVRGVEPVRAGLNVEVERGAGKRAPNGAEYHVRIKASTDSIARDHGIVPMRAWQNGGLRNFTENPIILAFHDHKQPIGRSVHTEIDGNALVEYWEFHLETDISRTMHKLYDRGFMRAASVGFSVLEFSFVDELDDKQMDKLVQQYGAAAVRDLYWIAERAELLETSAVPVPADASALTFGFDAAVRNAQAVGIDVTSLTPSTSDVTMSVDKNAEAAAAPAAPATPAPDAELRSLVEKGFAAINESISALRALVEKGVVPPVSAPAAVETPKPEAAREAQDDLEITIEKKSGETDEQAVERFVSETLAQLRGEPIPSGK